MHKKVFYYIDRTIEGLIALVLAAMVIVGAIQVFARYGLNQSLSWSEEFQKFSHIWLIFLTIPVAYNRGSHIGMEVLANKLPKVARSSLGVLTDIMWCVLGLAVIYYAAFASNNLMEISNTQTSPGLQIRMSYIYTCVVVGGGYLALVALRKLGRRFCPPAEGSGMEGASC